MTNRNGVVKRVRSTGRLPRAPAKSGTQRRGGRSGSGEVTAQGLKFEVQISVDGKKLPLKEFLHDLLGGAITGMVTALHGVHNPRRVDAVVRVTKAGAK